MNKYKVIKISESKTSKDLNKTIDGFDIKPKNIVKKKNTVRVSNARIADKALIKFLINKKIDKKYNMIFVKITEIASDDDDDGSKMEQLLGEVELFRSLLKNKYAKYLDLDEYHSLENRMYLISKELKKRIMDLKEEKFIRRSSNRRR